MRRRRAGSIFSTALIVLVVACEGVTSSPTTTVAAAPGMTTTTHPAATSTTVDPMLGEPLPTDPDLRTGKLDNGLTYYIRENDSPGGRAELRLLVDAGSVQEDADQAGMAHFVEHMMFNGTERFPRNELISALEAFGPRFGPDINAYTSFDETVYELSLSTEDGELVQLGIDVLREWATRATLTRTDVIEERGVILDEWRVRAQGFGARVTDELQRLVLADTAYEDRLPIGTEESIRTAAPAELRRFYEDWYRPGLMAVVAVGDFEGDEMESRIVEAFGDIETDSEPRPRDVVDYEPPDEPRVASHVDEEATNGGITVIWPTRSDPPETVGEYQRSVATSLGLQVLGSRLSDDALREGPLLSASVVDAGWTRAIAIRGVDTQTRPQRMDDALVNVLAEVERLRRDGISEEEFRRVLTSFETSSRQRLDQADSVQDAHITAQIASHHLAGSPLLSPAQRFEVESGIAGRLAKRDIDAALTSLMAEPPAVLVLGPDDAGLDVPDPDRILEVLGGLASMELDPREEIDPGAIGLMEVPAPAQVVEVSVDPQFEFTTLRFENGADVYLWESDISAGGVYMLVEGFGGTSLVDVEDLPEAHLMTDIVGRSGVGDIDVPTLQRLLADRIVSVRPWISETRHGLEGSASTGDLETLLQLLHLTMTEPRFDQAAVDAVLDEMRALNASRDDLPGLLFEEAVNEAYYGDDPRYFVVPSAEQIAEFDVNAAEQVYLDRFSDSGDFAIALVGDFESETVTDLVARYIGTLPGDPEPSTFVDNQPLPPREVQVEVVEAGSGQQGQLGMFFTNEFQPILADRVAARLTELILTARLRDRIREELSATYSITASIDLQRDPDPFAEANVISTGDPIGLADISDEVVAEIAALQQGGPTDAEFATAVEQMRDELALIDNGTIADRLITAHLYPDQPVSELRDRHSVLEQTTAGDVQDMANIAFDLGQRIEVRQIPRA
jgi:zinc protease